jgi:hypothetical protein
MVDAAEPTPKQIFENRTKAASTLYHRLAPDEQASINRQTKEVAENVNPPEIQQRSVFS